jgi:hypothetical protein
MISEVLKEISILFETRVEPGEVGLGKPGVGCYLSGFRHGIEVIGWQRRIHALVFDIKTGSPVRHHHAEVVDLTPPGAFSRHGALGFDRDQLNPRTVRIAASMPHCSSELRCPARSPSRLVSTAPICSTRTLVSIPPISISGRKDALRALVDVGAIRTSERGRSASDRTITPNALPCCSWPIPLGSLRLNMSPRRTKALHELGSETLSARPSGLSPQQPPKCVSRGHRIGDPRTNGRFTAGTC